MSNESLRTAKKAKNDEFYTRLEDIEAEVSHYWKQLKGKVVYCNCDDPKESNFWKYFHDNFHNIGLKELRATYKTQDGSPSYLTVYDGVRDYRHQLNGDGAFQSPECYVLTQLSDIVITNPPFSQFRDFIDILVSNNTDFLIIGNKNAITYRETFQLIKKNAVSIGYTIPKDFSYEGVETKKLNGLCRWFTTLKTTNKNKLIPLLTEKYAGNVAYYPRYDNYNAINVDRVKDIPVDYFGVMGVPITFLDKHNPDEFEILGITCREYSPEFVIKKYSKDDYNNANDLNGSACVLKNGIITMIYGRLLIKRRI